LHWGWITLIVVFVLLSLPLFVPIIVRVRAESETREFEYALALGPFALLPNLGENLSRYKHAVARPLYIITRPIVWLFKGLVILIRAVLWPFKMILRLFRKKRRVSDMETIRRDEVGEEWAEPAEFESDDHDESREEAGYSSASQWDDHGSAYSDDLGEAAEPPDDWMSADADEPSEDQGSDLPDSRGMSAESSSADEDSPKQSIFSKFDKVKSSYAQFRDMLRKYGRTGKRTLRAVFLLGRESFQALNFRVFDLQWSTGGDPATLGQILGWHYMMTGVLHPRMQRHVQFQPLWDSELLAPSGRANVVLYVWGYRFIPPLVRFIFRLPWLGVFRIVREQVFTRK